MQDAAMIVTRECMGIKKAEEVLIIVDNNTHSIGTVLFNAAKSLGAEVLLLEMLERETHGSEPPHLVAEAMKSASVIIMPTTKSLTHTKARLEATRQGQGGQAVHPPDTEGVQADGPCCMAGEVS